MKPEYLCVGRMRQDFYDNQNQFTTQIGQRPTRDAIIEYQN